MKAYPSLPLISLTKLQFYHSIKTLAESVHIYHKVGNGDGLKTYLPVVFVYTMVLSLYITSNITYKLRHLMEYFASSIRYYLKCLVKSIYLIYYPLWEKESNKHRLLDFKFFAMIFLLKKTQFEKLLVKNRKRIFFESDIL